MRVWGVIMIFTGFMMLGLTVALDKKEETLGEDNNDSTVA